MAWRFLCLLRKHTLETTIQLNFWLVGSIADLPFNERSTQDLENFRTKIFRLFFQMKFNQSFSFRNFDECHAWLKSFSVESIWYSKNNAQVWEFCDMGLFIKSVYDFSVLFYPLFPLLSCDVWKHRLNSKFTFLRF